MSTHGCFAPSFPSFSSSSRMPQPDVGAQDPDATVDDNYYSGGAYYYVLPADDDQEEFRRIPGRRPAPLSICIPVCASLLKANLFNLCLYSDIVASADSSMIEHLYSSPRGPWLVL